MPSCPNCGAKFVPVPYMTARNSRENECPACGAIIVARFGIAGMLVAVFVVLPILDVILEYLLSWFIIQYFPDWADHVRLTTFSLLAVIVFSFLALTSWYSIESE